MFYVGQKVVCVGFRPDSLVDRFRKWLFPILDPSPIEGEVYTVVNIIPAQGRDEGALELLEKPSPESTYWGAGWCAHGFRPVVSRPTSIEVFQRMLTPRERVADLCGNSD